MRVGDWLLVGFAVVLFLFSLFVLGIEAKRPVNLAEAEATGDDSAQLASSGGDFQSRRFQRNIVGIICLSLSIGLAYQCQKIE